jgi:hypothetical protein
MGKKSPNKQKIAQSGHPAVQEQIGLAGAEEDEELLSALQDSKKRIFAQKVEKGRKREDGAAIDKRCAFCQK